MIIKKIFDVPTTLIVQYPSEKGAIKHLLRTF